MITIWLENIVIKVLQPSHGTHSNFDVTEVVDYKSHLHYLLNTNKYEQMVHVYDIYPKELQLNKVNSPDSKAQLLDLKSISLSKFMTRGALEGQYGPVSLT